MATDLPTLESVDMVCLVLGPAGGITWANASGRRLNHWGDDARLIGARVEDLVHAASQALVRALIEQAVRQGRSEGTVQWAGPGTAPARYCHLVLSHDEDPYAANGSNPTPEILVQGWDVTVLVRRQQELEAQAFRDPVTGVSSRWAFMNRLQHELDHSRGTGNRVALLFADVDRFKLVNDTFGHEAGDCVLATIAARFQSSLRPGDTLGRIGGDEFAAICPSTAGWTAISSVMDRLRAAAAEPIMLTAGVVEVTVSIGAAFADEVALGATALMAQADARMFLAKAARR